MCETGFVREVEGRDVDELCCEKGCEEENRGGGGKDGEERRRDEGGDMLCVGDQGTGRVSKSNRGKEEEGFDERGILEEDDANADEDEARKGVVYHGNGWC